MFAAYKKYIIIGAAVVVVFVASALYYFLVYAPSHPPKPDDVTFKKEYGLILQNYAGDPVHLSAYKGKALIAYAWASWCPYCGAEIEHLAALKKIYGDDIEIVAINRAEHLADARAYTDKLQNTEGVLFVLDPDDAFFKMAGGYAMPETVFIDEEGNITYHQRGPIDIDAVEAQIKTLLGR